MIREKKHKKLKNLSKNKIFVIGVNTANGISEKLINRTICHPKRIISTTLHNKLNRQLMLTVICRKIKREYSTQNKMILDYGILLNLKRNRNL